MSSQGLANSGRNRWKRVSFTQESQVWDWRRFVQGAYRLLATLYVLLEPFDYKEWWLFFLTIAHCRRPGDISNGSVDVQRGVQRGFRHGSFVTYRCDAGFTLSGSRQRTCNDGQWSPDHPACKGIIIVVVDVIVIVIIIIIIVVVVIIIFTITFFFLSPLFISRVTYNVSSQVSITWLKR